MLLALLAPIAAGAQVGSASRLIGAELLDRDGADLGYITDLALDLNGGQERYAMVHADPSYAPGEALFGVPLAALRPALQREHLVLAHSAELAPATGREVDNARGKALGEIADFAVELDTGRVRDALFELHDSTRLSLPLTAFRFPELGGKAVLEGEIP